MVLAGASDEAVVVLEGAREAFARCTDASAVEKDPSLEPEMAHALLAVYRTWQQTALPELSVLMNHLQDLVIMLCSRGVNQKLMKKGGLPDELKIRLELAFPTGALSDAVLWSRLGNSKHQVFQRVIDVVRTPDGRRRKHARRGRRWRRMLQRAEEETLQAATPPLEEQAVTPPLEEQAVTLPLQEHAVMEAVGCFVANRGLLFVRLILGPVQELFGGRNKKKETTRRGWECMGFLYSSPSLLYSSTCG